MRTGPRTESGQLKHRTKVDRGWEDLAMVSGSTSFCAVRFAGQSRIALGHAVSRKTTDMSFSV